MLKFSSRFYSFIICHKKLLDTVRIALLSRRKVYEWINKQWERRRTCAFSMNLLEGAFKYNEEHYNAPKSMMIFFEPAICPDFTFGFIINSYALEYWLGDVDPTLETMTIRFTTHDGAGKDKDGAIRELGYMRGTELVRMVRVMQDPQWDLCVIGDPQPFEEGKSYAPVRGRKIKEYFTMEDMIRFATNWGCPFDRDEFWDSDRPMYVFGEFDGDEDLADWTEWPDGFVLPDA